jgi:D-psicose/D-tagatose/L-ribulose 3-epimerase
LPGFLFALEHAAHTGPLCIESFTTDDATIATAASIWRPLARTQDALATDNLAS